MLLHGNFDIRGLPSYSGSLRDVMRETILSQEIIFRKQVRELHRLYSIQKMLMQDVDSENFDRFYFSNGSISSSLVFENSTKNKVRPHSGHNHLLNGNQGVCSSLSKRLLDLRLPADQFIGVNLPTKENSSNCLERSTQDKNSLEGKFVSNLEDLKLSLSIGQGIVNKGCRNSKFCSSPEIIDVEDSTGSVSDEDGRPSSPFRFSASGNCFGYEPEKQVSVLADLSIPKSQVSDPACKTAVSCGIMDSWESCQYMNFNNQDTGCKTVQDDTYVEKQQFKSCGQLPIDLNMVLLDELECPTEDSIVVDPLTGGPSDNFAEPLGKFAGGSSPAGTCWEKTDNGCLNSAGDVLQHGGSSSCDLMKKSIDDDCKEVEVRIAQIDKLCQTEALHMDPELGLSPSQDLPEDHGSNSANSNALTSESQNGPLHERNSTNEAKLYSFEKRASQDVYPLCPNRSVLTIQDSCFSHSSASSESHCHNENNYSTTDTAQSGTDLGDLNRSASDELSKTQSVLEVSVKNSSQLNQHLADSSGMNHAGCNFTGYQAEVDGLIQKAAELLMCMSSKSEPCYHRNSSVVGSQQLGSDEAQPQISSDSFESITLRLTESSGDDYFATSTCFELNEMDKFSLKLKRGRRLKDFRRDILPGLASLSRQEIREDLNIFKAVMRSREYKRNRSIMADVGKWDMPKRSRSSRVNYARRCSYI